MNIRISSQLISCGFLLLLAGRLAQAQSPQKPAAPSQESQQELQQAIAAAQPGPQHAELMKRAGDYTTTQTFYAPGAQPQESTGTAKLKSILGGRFLEEENSGESLGQPYTGLRLYGYNNGSKQYEAIWIYNGSTAFLVLDGTSDDSGKTVRYSGAFLGPGGQRQTLRVVITQNDADHFSVKLLGEAPGGGMSTLETVYTRVNKAPTPSHR
ncbi:MAG TPA: DUF1579 domain-containing protein [Candidatus Acidoferrales bacterium]|nr:DUF1579 domain-containing protein [Candidatus Acidoferrales bacterium]